MEGHQSTVSSISTDGTGQYLVTADTGNDSSIVFWDTFTHTPIYTIFDPYPEESKESTATKLSESDSVGDEPVTYGGGGDEEEELIEITGTACAAISTNAKYLIAVATGKPVVKFWLWTYGKDEADGKH